MPLPRNLDPSETDDMIYFVAETAVQRLLNRIYSSLYASDNTDMAEGAVTPSNINFNKMLSLSSELDCQLQEWYVSILLKLRPPIGIEPIASYRGRVLRIRYYAAHHIIHRPFVLSVALQQKHLRSSSSGASSQLSGPSPPPPHPAAAAFPVPRVVLDKCETCINACTTYLYNVIGMLDRHSPYMWSFSQSCMACLLVLLVADSCPQQRPFTPDIKPLQALVVHTLKRWANPGSSFEGNRCTSESVPPWLFLAAIPGHDAALRLDGREPGSRTSPILAVSESGLPDGQQRLSCLAGKVVLVASWNERRYGWPCLSLLGQDSG